MAWPSTRPTDSDEVNHATEDGAGNPFRSTSDG